MLMKFLVAFFLITQVAVFVQSQSVLEVAQNLKLNTFTQLATLSGINAQLTSSGPVTIFIPTDQAFAKFGPELLATVTKSSYLWALREILLYHVVPGRYLAKDLRDGTLVTESRLKTLQVTNSSTTYLPLVNDAQAISVDNLAGSSVIHVINSVLLPLDLQPKDITVTIGTYSFLGSYPLNSFLGALSASGVGASLVQKIDRTVFVPTDAAFARLPRGLVNNLLRPENAQQLAGLLSYHILPGRVYLGSNANPVSVTNGLSRKLTFFPPNVLSTTDATGASFANTTILDGDIFAANGVVNIINDVLFPPELLPVDIPSTLPQVPNLSTFWAAVKATGNLVNVFQNAKDVTIFAPSDAAFQKLPAGMLQGFLNNLTTLRTLINAHVVRTPLLISDLVGTFPSNVAGFNLSFTRLPTGRLLLNGRVGINTVRVNQLSVNDVIATNGIIHVIDSVLFPPDLVPKDTLSSLPQANFSTFLAAVAATQNYGPILTTRLFPHTIFAPTNQAFAQLPKGYLQDLLKPANIDKLRAVVLYHITRGVNFLATLGNQTFVSVNNREKFYLLRTANDLFWLNPFFDASNQPELTFNYAGVVPSLSNMPATNGVVHAINKVILPPALSPLDLWGTISAHPLLKEFASVVAERNYSSVLSARGRELYTFFLPRDGTINSTSNPAIRQTVLANIDSYAISGAYLSSDLPKTGAFFAPSLSQRALNITVDANQRIYVNGVAIVQSDVIAKNGIIHILADVLSFV